MKARPTKKRPPISRARKGAGRANFTAWSGGIAALLEEARRQSARSVNAILTATYWEVGRRIVEFVQVGEKRAEYGDEVLEKLSGDLTKKFGRGFGRDNLQRMRLFYLAWPIEKIYATLSRESSVDLSLYLEALCHAFPLSWSHYVRLLSVETPEALAFYATEALRGGWSVRQLDRQISTQFYERTALAKNKARLLTDGAKPRPGDAVSVEEEIKSPYVLEFLGLRDDYAETELENALVRHLEAFLLELGNDFTFVARQNESPHLIQKGTR